MFRNPRTVAADPSTRVQPSTGRPPTPPLTPAKTPFTLAIPPEVPAPRMAASKITPSRPVPLPTIGRQGATSSTKKASPASKLRGKGNGNIMSFFKKTEQDAGLFVQERFGSRRVSDVENVEPLHSNVTALDENDDSVRFNESGESIKRRRKSIEAEHGVENGDIHEDLPCTNTLNEPGSRLASGPFLEDSDSEQGDERPGALIPVGDESATEVYQIHDLAEEDGNAPEEQVPIENGVDGDETPRPSMLREETSYGPPLDDFGDFEGMDDFDEDQFEDGDEYRERMYMEEQARLEAEENENTSDASALSGHGAGHGNSEEGPACPICAISLANVGEQDAAVHVNNCLDGNPTPLQDQLPKSPAVPTTKADSPPATVSAKQYRNPLRAPKPGQENPFTLGQPTAQGGSAFQKLMSGHAEDAAWAQAAASENSSRGKPSYQRTCPFYKILPGLFICVDAFRYGAVEGCQAYFLSHFHSDHYVGLTSHWTHGPIYCSKVTGNLVRQQLRVDPKFVVDLEWETPTPVPGTKGVQVTMISANHCPGSSLFLFEKVVGKKSNGEPRLQRILHCGDFRACREHLKHPLLMPNVQNKLKGTTSEQKIDVCYLDTTYLNPKYAFPSQDAVITACADMCVSLSKHSVDESDGWEQMKRQRAGEGMVKFVRKESNAEVKKEPLDEQDADEIKLNVNPHASQQIIATSTTPNVQEGRGRLLVVVGTYSIGKERICLGIAKALNSKIYAPLGKQRIVAALEDPELNARMTNDPKAAQVHMTPLFEIRAETLDDYLKQFFPHFTRAVGFRPSGWNYRPPKSRFTESPSVQTVLYSDNWKSHFTMKDLVPQRGSSSRASCFGVPYSEHSSFRELTMFCCALRIEKIIPTVNVGSAKSRERMKAWVERWMTERRKNGLFQLPEDGSW